MQSMSVKKRRVSISPILWIAIITVAISGSTMFSEYVKNGLYLCLNTVIPSLFPFMIISALITVGGYSSDIGSFFEKPLSLIFGTSPSASCAAALGFLCGYPVGALSASEMLDKGDISKDELEYLLSFINVPSATFVIGGVGGMLSSKRLGIAIYVSVILSAIISGMILRPFRPAKAQKSKNHDSRPKTRLSYVITEAISKGAKNMLGVCACVVTFSTLSGVICSTIPLPEALKAVISGFFEVASGAKAASTLPSAPVLCASICAFSGLSVHFQIISACRGRDISFVPFFVSKAVQAILAPAILSIYIGFCR